MRRTQVLNVVTGLALLLGTPLVSTQAAAPAPTSKPAAPASVRGPFVGETVQPYVFTGDLRQLPQLEESPTGPQVFPLRRTPTELAAAEKQSAAAGTPQIAPNGQMPQPIISFKGLDFSHYGAGWPPDTNGDVGPQYYIQFVNTSYGIYDKTTGQRVVAGSFDSLFTGTGTPCDNANAGDGVILYDYMADRWVISDFTGQGQGQRNYECIAVSRTGDPVNGGWYFYAPVTDTGGAFPDYPKLSVWPDAYYMTDNEFGYNGDFWVRAFAFDRTRMLAGQPMTPQYFDTCLQAECDSLLPSNVRGMQPPAGAPNYFMASVLPNKLHLWRFHVDWSNPNNSRFTGPIEMTVSPFDVADPVPQRNSSSQLDTLSPRLMFMLQYRNMGTHESLWANHSIDVDGRASIRWYEVRDPGGNPNVFQEGTYAPDPANRWMGSIAADRDGNAAVGYSVSSSLLYPAIRYVGRRDGEAPGEMPQAEASLVEGTGSQSGISRWGDYSAMTVDQDDDCTFWYTTEYYETTGSNWQTRIGSFKFAACGQAQGVITGQVLNSDTGQGVPGAPVMIQGAAESLTAQTDNTGTYRISILPGTYSVTAGPLLPGYPTPTTIIGVVVTVNQTTTAPTISLEPVPAFAYNRSRVLDRAPYGNANGYPEPGERFGLRIALTNVGATTATGVRAGLRSLTPGVRILDRSARYPDIPAGRSAGNSTAFRVGIAPEVPCGTELMFEEGVRTDQGTYTVTFSLTASIPQNPASVFLDTVENGNAGWTSGGTPNRWAITTETAHSPTHSWSDSPNSDYQDNADTWLRSPALDLSNKSGIQVSGWYSYSLESGYDYVYLEYSTNGGQTWQTQDPLLTLNGHSLQWVNVTVNAPQLENQANVRLRYRLVSDTGVHFDGIHIDDVNVTYVPVVCNPPQ